MWTIDVELVADWLVRLEHDQLIDTVAALELVAEYGAEPSLVARRIERGIEHWILYVHPSTDWLGPTIHFTVDDLSVVVFSGTGDDLDLIRRRPSYRKRHREMMASKSAQGLTLSEFVAEQGISLPEVASRKSVKVRELGRRRLADLRQSAGIDDEQMGLILSDSEYPAYRLADHIERDGIDCESVETLRKYVEACGARLRVQVEIEGTWVAIAQ